MGLLKVATSQMNTPKTHIMEAVQACLLKRLLLRQVDSRSNITIIMGEVEKERNRKRGGGSLWDIIQIRMDHICEQVQQQSSPFHFPPSYPSSIQQQSLLQPDCKICYLQYDSHTHYPMLICSSQHTLCLACFNHLSRGKQFIHCPFCKRGTETEGVVRFRFALSAGGQYRALREKYLMALDRLKENGRQDEGMGEEHRGVLMELQRKVRVLSQRLKSSQDANRALHLKISLQQQQYRAFQQQIIECKHNDILIKNRLTMVEYHLRVAQKDKSSLSYELGEVKREVSNLNLTIINLKRQNEALRQEVAGMKKEEGSMGKQPSSDRKVEKTEQSPEMELQGDDSSQHLFLMKKKSKSEQRIKTEMAPSTINHTHHPPSKETNKRVTTSRQFVSTRSKDRRKMQKGMKL